MKWLAGVLFLFAESFAHADIDHCDLSDLLPALQSAVTQALVAAFELENQELDTTQISITKNLGGVDYIGRHYESLDVRFVSPLGTKMSLRSHTYNPDPLYPSLPINFTVIKERDREGFLTHKTCVVSTYKGNMYFPFRPAMVNEQNGVIAPVSENLYRQYTKAGTLVERPIGFTDLEWPMTIEE